MKKQPEEDPVYKFIHLNGLAKTHQNKLMKGQKLELPSKDGKKIIIDKYNIKDGIIKMEVLEKDKDRYGRTSYSLEKKFVGIDNEFFSGFREMLTINHTFIDSKAQLLTSKNTRLDFTKGKVIEDDIKEIKDLDNSKIFEKENEYLRGYFMELEKKEKKRNTETSIFSSLFKKPLPDKKSDLKYKEDFEKISEIAQKHRGTLRKGNHIEFNLTPDTKIIIDKYKPDLKLVELDIVEKKAGTLSRISYKMEKDFVGMSSGFGDTCYSKALLTVNHSLLNTRDKSVNLKETQIDCIGCHIKEISTQEIKRTQDKKEYDKYADYIRGYLAELNTYKKPEESLIKNIKYIKDKPKVQEYIRNFTKIRDILDKEKAGKILIPEGTVFTLTPEKKLVLDEEYPEAGPKSFHIIEKYKNGFKKTEYELDKRYIGGCESYETGFQQILRVNTTLLDTKGKMLSFDDSKIDIDHKILIESQREIIKKSEDKGFYEHYEKTLLDEGKILETSKPKQSFLSFLSKFRKGTL
ncbi:MAG: hypothetical protein BWY64_00378 [bacterium ADurb.Bin363]|mgnify:FL=1|nr:MAG: hypothetical protein BWY64_00378 [bacterium ADurb.Bin363]